MRRLDGLAVFAHGLSAAFTLMGLMALAGGDANIGANRLIHDAVHMGGSDRLVFGFVLLAAGYVLWRWVFRPPGEERRLAVELRIGALFAVAGCLASLIGA